MKKILVISWFYPPVNSSEGLVTYKLLKNSKLQYDVFTQKSNSLWSYGTNGNLPECDNINVIYAQTDNLELWKKKAVDYYNENREKYDIVMTRSMPPESHQIGLQLKKLNPKLIWIASFGDPISDNPYTKIALTVKSPYSRDNCRNIFGVFSPKRIIKSLMFSHRQKVISSKILKKDSRLQNDIFKFSDYLIMNSAYQMEYMLKASDDSIKKKAFVLNHSFDSELYCSAAENKSEKIKFSYIGHLDSIRTPKLLFMALKKLLEEDASLANKVEFDFYGHLADSDKLYIIDNQLTDIIKIKKPIEYLESLKIMAESDWLLQIDADISSAYDKNIFFAAKLADYIGSESKIFGITMINGISADIINNLNQPISTYSVEEIKNYLWLIIYDNYDRTINSAYRDEFDAVNVARKFDEKVLSIKN